MKTKEEVEEAERQIRTVQQVVDYTVREYPVEVLVEKHLTGEKTAQNEIFVPDYQRDLVWEDKRQAKFIESLLIGLPVPYLFVADVGNEDPELEGRLEIVDGTQRIRTLARFLTGELVLDGLEKLPGLNGFRFGDLPASRQRRFGRITLRLIELTEKADEETRRDMFDRINTGPVRLNDMESRRGRMPGPFVDLVREVARQEPFKTLAPLSEAAEKRFEREELAARFFAYMDDYTSFGQTDAGKVVSMFVDDYAKRTNATMIAEGPGGPTEMRLREAWDAMIRFVAHALPHGFRKSPSAMSTPRVRFEAIAVGAALAMKADPALPGARDLWSHLSSTAFRELTTSDAANNRSRVTGRIEFVRDRLLGR
ncbi:DUF262 domain-containing protein [Methylorubrum populi]|uniref:DUF262 domain-containing protein n=1 Tax=Methylorubrum rhodesianum TaxID=29427 RepID=A0ABU9Z7B4_9HYPH|nr:DUF262 domain-containing protein [Methylorubrum rhodesianum]MBK3403450.1 DUF262 domain-containing protein [Methylorubrum rhodesianum]MBY0140324.1 DUF262 domain-containing protein [Methylorubrum populi]